MAVDKLQYAIGNSASTTSSSAINNTDTELPLTSDTNFAAKTGEGLVLVDEGEATEELAYATGKTGATLTVPLANRGLEGGSAQAHVSGATVKGILSAGMWNNLIDAMVNVVLKTTGALDTTKVVDLTTAQTLTNKTLTSPKLNENVALTATSTELNLIHGTTVFPVKNAASDIKTGTDEAKFATAKSIHDAGILTTKSVVIQVLDGLDSTVVGDGKAYFTVPPELNGMNLVAVHAKVVTAGTTNATTIQIANVTGGHADILSTKLTIDSTETGSDTAATPAVINASYDDVATNDLLRIDIDAVSTTAAKGLVVRLQFQLP